MSLNVDAGEIRQAIKFDGYKEIISSITSNKKRARFSIEPPY
jgi:hypothetical protein